jgi:hypothetical protein
MPTDPTARGALTSITEVEVNISRRRRVTPTAALTTLDRFVPRRSIDLAISSFEVEKAAHLDGLAAEEGASPAKEEYKRVLAKSLFRGKASNNRILSFGNGGCGAATAASEAPSSSACSTSRSNCDDDSFRMLYARNRHELGRTQSRAGRYIPQSPERILDAPDLIDDYYVREPTDPASCFAFAHPVSRSASVLCLRSRSSTCLTGMRTMSWRWRSVIRCTCGTRPLGVSRH